MRKYFVVYETKDKQTITFEFHRFSPICGRHDIHEMEQLIASDEVKQGAIALAQLPIRIIAWQKFEQPE